jgi:hypothetical protein
VASADDSLHGSNRDERSSGERWTVVARFANAAEAGYFANELDYLLGSEPRLDCRDDFDAVQHHWRSGYVLSVPDAIAERARVELRGLLEDGGAAAHEREEGIAETAVAVSFDHRRVIAGPVKAPGATVKWGPLFLTLAAGSLVIWHGKKPQLQRQPANPRDVRVSLYDAPGLREAPWVQQSGDGVRRELDFTEPGGTAVLREDRDGDGAFDREYSVRISD